MTETQIESIVEEKMVDKLLKDTIYKKLKKQNLESLNTLANNLNIEVKEIKPNGKIQKKKRINLLNDIECVIKSLSSREKVEKMKISNIGIEIEVKHILEYDIDINEFIGLGLCLPLQRFFEENPVLQADFTNSCDLINISDTIKSNNCNPIEVQGLYILTISKNDIDYIVKLGSFAESQGMYKRICSFGGGNYETGSLTNKWFQRFIKKALEQGYTSKFTYYNRYQEKIIINNLDGEPIEMIPYVMRPLETDLFIKYYNTNNNIPPIFGSNCCK
jgi:hypothetical protein